MFVFIMLMFVYMRKIKTDQFIDQLIIDLCTLILLDQSGPPGAGLLLHINKQQ